MSDLTIGVHAVEDVARIVYGVHLEKAALNPNNHRDFMVIQKRIADALKGISARQHKSAIARVLDILDVDWAKVPLETRRRLTYEANKTLAAAQKKVAPLVINELRKFGSGLVKSTKGAVKADFGLRVKSVPSGSMVDERVINQAVSSQAHYIRDANGKRLAAFSADARRIVAEGISAGKGQNEIAKDLRESVGAYVDQDAGYWAVVADVFSSRARVYGSLRAYDEAEIETFKFLSVLDEVTTEQCRFMDGRIFSVKSGLKKYADIAAGEPESVVTITPWMSEGVNEDKSRYLYYKDPSGSKIVVATSKADGGYEQHVSDSSLESAGVFMPPLHARCRSTTIPL